MGQPLTLGDALMIYALHTILNGQAGAAFVRGLFQ